MAKKSKSAQKRKSIPWNNFTRSDWRPLGGKSRRYVLRSNSKTEISRESFDKHYGALRDYGSFKKKAQKSKGTIAQASRPARGRSSTRKKSAVEQEQAFSKLEQRRREQRADRTTVQERKRKGRIPKNITLKDFKHRSKIARFRVPFDTESIEQSRENGQASKIIWSYYVIFLFVNRSGDVKSYAIFSSRSISYRFTKKDFQNGIRLLKRHGYGDIVGAEVVFKLTGEAQRRNGIQNPS